MNGARWAWIVAAVALVGSHRRAASMPALPSVAVGAWAPYWDFPTAIEQFRRQEPRVAEVFLFVSHLDARGDPIAVWPEQEYARAVEAIRSAGASAWLTVVNDVVDASGETSQKVAGVVHDVLSDPERRRRHRAGIVALARAHGVSGVDLDYENLWARDRELFSTFVAELAAELEQAGMLLSVTVQPKSAETRADGPGAADWAQLCRSADRLQIMLYNEHGRKTRPGPLATISWIDRVLSYAASQCSPGKIVPAIKVIGMEWSPGGTRDVAFARATELLRTEGRTVRRHPDGDVPWFSYGPGDDRTVYYEDARSLALKLQAAQRHGADRVVLWSLGAEDPALWSRIDPVARPGAPRD